MIKCILNRFESLRSHLFVPGVAREFEFVSVVVNLAGRVEGVIGDPEIHHFV